MENSYLPTGALARKTAGGTIGAGGKARYLAEKMRNISLFLGKRRYAGAQCGSLRTNDLS
jgi:hypothetical protein